MIEVRNDHEMIVLIPLKRGGHRDYLSRGSLRTLVNPQWLNELLFVNSSIPRDCFEITNW